MQSMGVFISLAVFVIAAGCGSAQDKGTTASATKRSAEYCETLPTKSPQDDKSGLRGETDSPLELVVASTLYKMLLLDLKRNLLLGATWADRDREGCGSKALTDAMARLRAKYAFDHPTRTWDLHLDFPPGMGLGGGNDGDELVIELTVPPHEAWCELFRFENGWGKLPIVKYRSGTIRVNVRSFRVTFTDGMRILVDGKEYRYEGDTLRPAAEEK